MAAARPPRFTCWPSTCAPSGHTVLTTREPGGTRIGDGIRQLLLDLAHTEMNARAETLLFNAARAQIVAEVIRPALAAANIVLCDRFADSTLAYQGYGHRQDIAELARLIEYATGGLRPDLTIYLDIPPEDGIRRNRGRAGGDWNRLDAQELSFYQRVANGYRQLIAQQPQRWTVIDASRSRDQIHLDIVRALQQKLPALAPSR